MGTKIADLIQSPYVLTTKSDPETTPPPTRSAVPLTPLCRKKAPEANSKRSSPIPGAGYGDPNAPPSTFVPSQGIDDKLPNHFKINDQYVKARVTPSDLQAHLVLLGAFHRLREEVRTFKGNSDVPTEPDEGWAVFLQRSLYRFDQWAVQMIGGEGQEEVLGEGPRVLAPNEVSPLDVIRVWHTYMLNPRTYYEDYLRKLPGLLQTGRLNRPRALPPHPPSGNRVSAFNSSTGQPFEPPVNTTSDETVTVFCQSCSQPNTTQWITFKGDGFAQRGYGCICENCRLMFTREALGVRTFYEDMEKCIVNLDRFFLANTIVDYHTGHPLRDGTIHPAPAEAWGKDIGWTMKAVEAYCRIGILGRKKPAWIATPRPLNIIPPAYRQPGPFSLDLASAAIRQMNFIKKMVNLGFTEHARWEEDHDTLTRCVVRYHHFLDLMVSTPGNFVVPSLITPFRLGNLGLCMRSGSRTSGRSTLSSASEAEFGNERFRSVGKIARLSFASESDSDLEAILKIRDSTDTVKATPKAKPRSSVPARTMPRDDSAILMPPPSSFPQRGFKPDESSDAPPESPLSPDLDGDLRSSTGSVASSTSSMSSVKTKVVGDMTEYLHSSASRAATVPQSQVSGDSKNEIKFPSRLGHKRSQSTLPTASPRPYSPAPSAIPAYTRRTSTDAVRVFTNSTPSTNPLRSSVPLKYAGLPAAIALEAGARSLSTASSSAISPTSYYHSGNGEHRSVSGGDVKP
ncbi:hypothetical protein FRC04_011560 [Tulasnella sp. 424]|nr:hypothetical protein FRC04_011560 [Tulasnella sp. 424]